MPYLGETVKALEIGYKRKGKLVWAACEDCGKQRWVVVNKGKPIWDICYACGKKQQGLRQTAEKAPNWRGGRYITPAGYVNVYLHSGDFFYPMVRKDGHVFEHRLVVAKHLGRCLQSWEKVHHKDGIKNHNEYSNLKLTTLGSHTIEHSKGYRDGYREGYADGQNTRIDELLKHIKFIEWQLREKSEVLKLEEI